MVNIEFYLFVRYEYNRNRNEDIQVKLRDDETNTENASLYNFCLMIQDEAPLSRESFSYVWHA
jgi:hypothetical protein